MNRLIRQFLVVLLALLFAGAALGEPVEPAKLYAVVFEVTINPSGKVTGLQVSKVIDPSSGSDNAIDLSVPAEYVVAARAFLSRRTYSSKDKQFFTYTFYDPMQPSKADIDPRAGKR